MKLLVIVAVLAALSVDMASQASSRRRSRNRLPASVQEMCQSGDGSSYRGTISESKYGKRCLRWDWFKNPWGASEGVGKHNYCRNPDLSLMPWCFVRRGRRTVREFCDIPQCSTPTTTPPPSVDTELTCGERSEKLHKIVGGSFTPIDSQPWVAAIFKRNKKFLCGGSLIAPCWVVTAAHCFSDGGEIENKDLSVYLGKTATNETDARKEQRFTVVEQIIHPKYNTSNYDHDIALLKIKGINGGCAVKSAYTRTVCLPPHHTQLPAGFQCSIAGYGLERQFGWHHSKYLKQANVNIISQTDCKSKLYYGDLISDNMLCAGSPDWSADACEGDSGGPLVCEMAGRMFLFGVVSWGEGCAKENRPGVYTQVTNYNKWIATSTGLSKYTNGLMYPIK